MVFDNPSAKIYDCFFRRKPLVHRSSDVEPIALPNAAGTWDHFLFGTESQLRSWFGWMFDLFGTGSLAFDDGGFHRGGLFRRQKDAIQAIYMDFFRPESRNRDNPAMVRIWGCGPLGESPATKERVLAIQDKRLIGFKVFENNDRGTAPFSLRLMEGRKVKIPAGFLAVPEKKLNRAARFRRWREINDRRSNGNATWQHQHEFQVGTEENVVHLGKGDFLVKNNDRDIIPVRYSALGAPYEHAYVIRLMRLVPGYRQDGAGRVGESFTSYMMEEVYITIRGTNGCVNKVGAVWSPNFNASARYHSLWMEALQELERRHRRGG